MVWFYLSSIVLGIPLFVGLPVVVQSLGDGLVSPGTYFHASLPGMKFQVLAVQ